MPLLGRLFPQSAGSRAVILDRPGRTSRALRKWRLVQSLRCGVARPLKCMGLFLCVSLWSLVVITRHCLRLLPPPLAGAASAGVGSVGALTTSGEVGGLRHAACFSRWPGSGRSLCSVCSWGMALGGLGSYSEPCVSSRSASSAGSAVWRAMRPLGSSASRPPSSSQTCQQQGAS